MKILTTTDFLMICRKVVEQLGQHPAMNSQGVPRRINSFVGLIDLNLNINHPSFGANYSDYNQGRFWARDWVASGADPNTMAGNFPVVMMEEKAAVLKNLKTSILKKEIVFYSLDKNSCDGCPPEIRSPHSAYETALFWFRAFLKGVLEHQIITVLPSGDELWITKEEAQQMKDAEKITDYRITGIPMTTWLLHEGEFKLEPFSDGVLNGARGYYTKMFVQVCDEANIEYNFERIDWHRIAVQNCDSCQ
jgi:hypothetical protein